MIQLSDEFVIADVPPERAYESLLDLQNVAGCVPGGEIDPPDADGIYPGRVTVKLGPMKFAYEGTVRIAERDGAGHSAVIEGAGKAAGGSERARVRSVMEVTAEGTGSRVRMTTDLEIKGRAAQMGAGIIRKVSSLMVSQAADCLAARLAAADPSTPSPDDDRAT